MHKNESSMSVSDVMGGGQSKAKPLAVMDIKLDENTDSGNARRLVERHGDKLRYCYAWKSWMSYTGTHWERGRTGQIFRLAKDTIDGLLDESEQLIGSSGESLRKFAVGSKSATKLKAMVFLAESEDGIAVSTDELDTNKMLFNVQNGTIDLSTGKLLPHNPKDYITRISPIVYDKNAKCDRWMSFLGRIMRTHPEIIEYLQLIAGAFLCGEVRDKALYIFWGQKGNNGKTTFIETIQRVMEDYAEGLPIDSLLKMQNKRIPNDIAGLKGVRFVYASEPEMGDTLSEGMIKKLTGLGRIKARFLNEEFFQFLPEFNILIETNNRPRIKSNDGGTWNRVNCIPFIEEIPVGEQDPLLMNKLMDERSGIFNWMLEGCGKWLEEGIKTPEIVRQITEEYRRKSNKFGDFIDYCFVEDSQAWMPSSTLYKLYRIWCANNDQYPIASNTFGEKMLDYGEDKVQRYTLPDGTKKQARGFTGVRTQEWLTKSVTAIVEATDSDLSNSKWLLLQGYRLECTQLNSEGSTRHSNTSISPSHPSQPPTVSTISSFSESVKSVTTVTTKEEIKEHIKERYKTVDKSPNPDSLHTLIVEEVVNELDIGKYDDSYEVVEGIVTEYLNPPEASQRDFIHNVRECIRSRQNATQYGAELATVLSEVEGSESRIMYAINQLKSQGEIMELGTECYKVV